MSMPWYKRDPEAFLVGVERMTLEEVGAYALLIDHMYLRGGPLRDSPTFLAGLLGVDVRVWHRLRAALMRKAKLVETDGYLSNARVEVELEAQAEMRAKRAQAGRASGRSRRQNSADVRELSPSYGRASSEVAMGSALVNAELSRIGAHIPLETKETGETHVQHMPEHNRTDRDRDRDIPPIVPHGDEPARSSAAGASDPVPIDRDVTEAFELFSKAAGASGWVVPQKLDKKRRSAIRVRLREDGGLDGWRRALAEAQQMPFLGGDNDRKWRMDLEYFVRPSGWRKIIEGGFSKRPGAAVIQMGAVDWPLRYKVFSESGRWRDTWGPRPGEYGHEGPGMPAPRASGGLL